MRRAGTERETTEGPAGGVPPAGPPTWTRPPADIVESFVRSGRWRRETLIHDLHRGCAVHPGRIAIVAHRAAGGGTVRLTYAQLTAYVERFAHGLVALGVRPGDPVAFQLPNWWEACALFLACLRIGAVAVPVMPGYGTRDLEAVLVAAQPTLCVVPDLWEGAAPAEALTELAPSLPWLRHRVVYGNAAATGAVDFAGHFLRTPHERYHRSDWLRAAPDGADRVCLVVNSVGLRDTHSMFMHTSNTLHAALTASASLTGASYSALPLASLPSLLHALVGPLTHGGTVLLQDVWEPEGALDLMAESGVDTVLASPAHWAELEAAQRLRPKRTPALRGALSSDPDGTTTRLVQQVHEVFRVPLYAVPAESTGETVLPAPGGRRTPGPASCVAVWRKEGGGLLPTWGRDDGTFPGAAAGRDDHTGADEIGGLFLLPLAELEAALLAHPRVTEAAVVAYTDPVHGELACAVVVPAGPPPSLLQVCEHLVAHGVTRAHLPARIELMGGLPRTERGEVDRRELRDWLGRRLTLSA